ncbi:MULTISPECIES: helix-turn-helix domain-containing protein [Rhizobiaceae]|jgi:transcriptional regulator with XRE-family HTH domain|uniref:Transcriptional regulator with XRE-family HTH domain n=1 Tax=Aliirhizobium cellulosilyticum TaxID=393664 RepID=A0A7W6TGX7_9HYPH|nr:MULTISPECIES: helix-turn-helix transcriptional regulator [Rhizobium/Agrobacterium group]MBB4349913.1 transcriptional regulator with XRE-family HTH domain [Rhizobium cellulosilyticum]MBB4413092.1 transcriptional regulator with XRE-family HTH domain [Rhizobium cellulosilyticum]MBB4447971.1 transcriptional regulator with XRE-family HTH domain [Rhizobium cellulosilyticum]MBO0142745.1 helix-turn-helix transcriptional regulator [Agrobacterium sp. Ap1]
MSNRKFQPAYGIDDTLGGRISLARDARDISVEEAAQTLGIEPVTWSDWENDRSEPLFDRLEMMASVLQVSVAWLADGRGTGPRWS